MFIHPFETEYGLDKRDSIKQFMWNAMQHSLLPLSELTRFLDYALKEGVTEMEQFYDNVNQQN